MKQKTTFKLGNCKIVPIENSIMFDGKKKSPIQPKSIEVLCYLAENYPSVISREELINKVWGENSVVGDNGLTNTIWHLRKILKPINHDGEIIETIRKVGYKLSISPEREQATSSVQPPTTQISNTSTKIKKSFSSYKKIMYASISILLLIFISSTFKNKKLEPLKDIQITKQQGTETHPSPSPNGKFVAYNKISITDGTTDLYIKNIHNLQQPPKRLTFDEHKEGFSVWSNSGEYLYFSRENKDKNECKMVELNTINLQEKEIANCRPGVKSLYLDISPDDKILAYSHKEKAEEELGVYFIRLDQEKPMPIRFSCNSNCEYEDRDLAFSPDGKTIAISRRTNDYSENIFLVNLKDRTSEQLTYKQEDILGFTWYPDGKKLIYAAQKSDNRYAYILDLDTQKTQSLPLSNFNFPSLAKKSNELFYEVLNDKYHISQLQLNDGVASSPFPTIQSEFNHLNSDYSKQRNKIVYSSNESGYYELWSSDPNGANKRQLTNLKTIVQAPRWSNSGEKIAFLSAPQDSISILDIKTHKVTQLPSPFTSHYRPTWSYDDKAIISNVSKVDADGLYQIDIASGRSKQLTSDKGRLGIMTSPSTMLYSISGKGLWQKDIIKNTPPINIIDSSLFRTRYTWAYNDNGVYFKQKTKNIYQLNFYDLMSKKLTPLIRIPKHALKSTTSLTFIDNANRLLFTSAENPQSSIHMLKLPLSQ